MHEKGKPSQDSHIENEASVSGGMTRVPSHDMQPAQSDAFVTSSDVPPSSVPDTLSFALDVQSVPVLGQNVQASEAESQHASTPRRVPLQERMKQIHARFGREGESHEAMLKRLVEDANGNIREVSRLVGERNITVQRMARRYGIEGRTRDDFNLQHANRLEKTVKDHFLQPGESVEQGFARLLAETGGNVSAVAAKLGETNFVVSAYAQRHGLSTQSRSDAMRRINEEGLPFSRQTLTDDEKDHYGNLLVDACGENPVPVVRFFLFEGAAIEEVAAIHGLTLDEVKMGLLAHGSSYYDLATELRQFKPKRGRVSSEEISIAEALPLNRGYHTLDDLQRGLIRFRQQGESFAELSVRFGLPSDESARERYHTAVRIAIAENRQRKAK